MERSGYTGPLCPGGISWWWMKNELLSLFQLLLSPWGHLYPFSHIHCLLTWGIWISGMGSTLPNSGLGIWTLPVQPSSFKWPFSFLRLWRGMRRITIKIPQNRFGIRSTCTSVFTQQSGKPSLILCKRIKWRLSDWFMPAPGWGFLLDQRSKEGCASTHEAGQTPWNQKVTMRVRARTQTHTIPLTFHFGEDTVSQRLQFIFF